MATLTQEAVQVVDLPAGIARRLAEAGVARLHLTVVPPDHGPDGMYRFDARDDAGRPVRLDRDTRQRVLEYIDPEVDFVDCLPWEFDFHL